MKILLVGSIQEDKWIGSLIRNLKKNEPELVVDFFNTDIFDTQSVSAFTPLCNRVVVTKRYFPSFFYRIPKIRVCLWLIDWILTFRNLALEMKARNEKYDVTNLHYLIPLESYCAKYIKMISKKVVLTPWGSDILRATPKTLNKIKRLNAIADYVACGRDIPRFKEDIIRLLEVPEEKLVRLGFGTEMIDLIQDNQNMTREEAKAKLGLKDKYVIACGYNANKAQNHLLIIDAIQVVRNQLSDKLVLLFQMTYGAPQEYIDSVRTKLDELQLPYKIIVKYMTNTELLYVRKCADMFIHAQKTDANSGSLAENLLCGAKVINGAWLKYPNREKFGTPYYTFHTFEELSEVLVRAYKAEYSIIPIQLKHEILKDGWGYEGKEWNEFYHCCALGQDHEIIAKWGVVEN